YSQEKGCLPDTRGEVIEDIILWARGPHKFSSKSKFWLHGPAGAGKSSIANTVAMTAEQMGLFGSFFAFSTSVRERRPHNLLATITRDLADCIPEWKKSLWSVIRGNTALRSTPSLGLQFEKFMVDVAEGISDRTLGPILVVIDALDESGAESERSDLLRYIARLGEIGPSFRFLITSRTESDIAAVLGNSTDVLSLDIAAVDGFTTKRDIRRYVGWMLSRSPSIATSKRWIEEQGSIVDTLVEHADLSFQWASTACKFISGEGQSKAYSWYERFRSVIAFRLEKTRQGVKFSHLDALYQTVLEILFPQEDADGLGRLTKALALVVATREPLTRQGLQEFYSDYGDFQYTEHILSFLGSLISGVSRPDIPIRPLHSSFRELLLEPDRSGTYCVAPSRESVESMISSSSLRILRTSLKFNICRLETSYLLNSEIQDMPDRVALYISPGLSYSCRFWSAHLEGTPLDDGQLHDIESLFSTAKILFWIEVLSILGSLGTAAPALGTLLKWTNTPRSSIVPFVRNVQQFVRVYAPAMSISVPQIYLSALSFAPNESLIATRLRAYFPRIAIIGAADNGDWPALQSVLQTPVPISAVAFSPEGTRIASGSRQGIVQIWDAETGEAMSRPLHGHTDVVYCVLFSPDGSRIGSGSWDNTVRIWDTRTGRAATDPLLSHSDDVTCLSFSSDGGRLASGSRDRTVRVWDAYSGDPIGAALEDTDPIYAVAFSHGGRQVTTVSEQVAVRIRDIKSGDIISVPFHGIAMPASSIAISPGGDCVAAGFRDGSVGLWDAVTGAEIIKLHRSHTANVWSLSFSFDGRHFASGSWDETIRVWNTSGTGNTVSEPLRGHTNAVWSVGFSPDGSRIISGAPDKTIRVWDAYVATTAGEPSFDGCGNCHSITFSPDNTRVASGSDDSVSIWDVRTGAPVGALRERHNGSVLAVVYSPDGNLIATGADSVCLWDAKTGESLVDPGNNGPSREVQSLTFLPDGSCLACGTSRTTILVWDARTGKAVCQALQGHTRIITTITFSADGRLIASGSWDRTIRVWSVLTGEPIVDNALNGHTDAVDCVAFSADGTHIVSGSSDMSVRIWNTHSGASVGEPLRGHTQAVCSVAFSPDRSIVASGSEDQTIRVWNAHTGELVGQSLCGHTGTVLSLAFSSDGARIASGSMDHTIRVWDAPSVVPDGSVLTRASLDSEWAEHMNARLLIPEGSVLTRQEFMDSFRLLGDGWMVGPGQQRLIWIPPRHRAGLLLPRCKLLIPTNHATTVDLRRFVHGMDWMECIMP
ncbi:WD40 repeat-like protein, partial [Punctularia strigosozonata HHB-11173 SS5]|uniref:WD40 repeat-like protein n=1 Tax=Punctularia strigosozonata (strain HHB-11173) TaxID=741275 RepID=UPI00044172E8